ncbi:3748_t:CDS:2 [Ambispora leptoticha]|uniref:3748_t:CDS:1 n=1 Tax=Ambispora leptoticha TaxID=144679 RepID=A0A9N9FN17_9GLOM|nr:3748_t:CDS:2 [Ambispora leptoticha]
MKFQSIILCLTVVLTSVIYAQAGVLKRGLCTIHYAGNTKHETGNTSGCYGIDESDPVKTVSVTTAGSSYIFYSDYGCKGAEVFRGKDSTTQNPPKKAKSVLLTCS